jgi:hypothetical protein
VKDGFFLRKKPLSFVLSVYTNSENAITSSLPGCSSSLMRLCSGTGTLQFLRRKERKNRILPLSKFAKTFELYKSNVLVE